jgi:hypothetical protein
MNVIEIIKEAEEAGAKAFVANNPTPVIFAVAANLTGNEIIPGTEEYVADGVCGFAWVSIYPKKSEVNKQFIKALKDADMIDINKDGRCTTKDYPFSKINYLGPVHYQYWVSYQCSQSMQRKEAFAEAFVKVLEKHGITAYVHSRMD